MKPFSNLCARSILLWFLSVRLFCFCCSVSKNCFYEAGSNHSGFLKQSRIRYCVRRELTHQPEKGFAVFTLEFRPIFCFKIMYGTVGNAKKQPHFIIRRKSLYDVRIIDYRKRISEKLKFSVFSRYHATG